VPTLENRAPDRTAHPRHDPLQKLDEDPAANGTRTWTMKAIDFDVHCAGCGYDLRGRPLLGRCSECGATVASTINAVSQRERSLGRMRDSFLGGAPRSMVNLGLALLAVISLIGALRGLSGARQAGSLAAALAWTPAAAWIVGRYTAFLTGAPRPWHLAIFFEVLIVLVCSVALAMWIRPVHGAPLAAIFTSVLLPTLLMPRVSGLEYGECGRQRLAVFVVQWPSAFALAWGLS